MLFWCFYLFIQVINYVFCLYTLVYLKFTVLSHKPILSSHVKDKKVSVKNFLLSEMLTQKVVELKKHTVTEEFTCFLINIQFKWLHTLLTHLFSLL